MSLNSVNTNVGAMIALQSLNAINGELFTVQKRISTGLRVSSVKDDPATWAIAQNQRAASRSLDAVKTSLQRGQSITDVAIAGAESISDLLIQMKEKALAASDSTITAADKALLSEDYIALRKQIDRVATNATFGGVSLISSGSAGNVRSLANSSASSTIDVDHVDLSTTGGAISGTLVDLSGAISTADLTAIDTALKAVNAATAKFGTGAKALGYPPDLRRQTPGCHRRRRRPPGRRRPRQGKRTVAGAAGQAAAGDHGARHRQQRAVDAVAAVPKVLSRA